MKIAITGAGGLVGGQLARELAAEHTVLALKRRDLDITDAAAVGRLISGARPDVVINCAVLNVDECERDPALARAVNVAGPQSLAAAAAEVSAELIHFSTNYVFDGARENRRPYTIEDETRPVNVYGRTKLAGERAVRDTLPRSFIIRTSWVFGHGKETFLSTVHRHLLAGTRFRAIKDIWASATYVADLAARTKEILARRRYAVYHVVNEGICSYHEFALEAARLLGMSEADAAPLIEVVREADLQRAAVRPHFTALRCLVSEELGLAPLRDWRAALAEYIRADRYATTDERR
jgi:dTDP-4-dehydrorhamnose reductase